MSSCGEGKKPQTYDIGIDHPYQDWIFEYLPSLLSRHHQGHLHISGSVLVEEMQLFFQTLVEHKPVLLQVTVNNSTNPVSTAHS